METTIVLGGWQISVDLDTITGILHTTVCLGDLVASTTIKYREREDTLVVSTTTARDRA